MRKTCNTLWRQPTHGPFRCRRRRASSCPDERPGAGQDRSGWGPIIRPRRRTGKQCDGCNFFVAPNACKMVDGEIAPTGWCALWVKKAAA